MRLRALMTLFVGVAVAGSAVVYVHTSMKMPAAQPSMRDIVVATEPIPFGHVIEAEMLAVQTWPANAVPDDAFSSLSQVTGQGDVKPRRAKFSLAKGDILFGSKISEFGEEVSITQQIDPDMRAVTIRVNDVTGVAGFIAPADRIDLTLTRTVERDLVTSTILQDVEVLGIDKQANGARREPAQIKTVTVQVKPVDAQKLALAQQAGTLSLSLRHIDAADQQTLGSISVGDLTDRAKPKPKVKRSGLPSIVVNRAGKRSTVDVPSG
ncbi:MAG: Flp pilus assembly protein CpaB [Geminicoccaceae bacterium]